MRDLVAVGVSILTLGQYLRPSAAHLPVARYYHPDEFAEMRKHPVHGARILANIKSPLVAAVLPGVQYHHEKWDGTGYPEGLRGSGIPLLGRLLGVADFLDALMSERAYHAGKSIDEVVQLIAEGAGVHFDPEIADAVVRLHARGALNVDEAS